MPNVIATAIAASVTGTTYAAAAATVSAGFAAASSTFVLSYAGTYLATTALIGAAIKKNLEGSVESGTQGGITYESQSPRRRIYGETLIGGNVVYAEAIGSDNKNLDLVIALADGEINDVTKVYIGDDEVSIDSGSEGSIRRPVSGNKYRGHVEFYFHHGRDDQTANSTLVSRQTNWTSNHRLRGIAYAYVRLIFDEDIFTRGIPNLRFVVQGSKVYDPRKDTANGYSGSGAHTQTDKTTWEYSSNPILALRDFLTYEYGFNASGSEVDEARFIEMANECDDDIQIDIDGTTQKRFTIGGMVSLATTRASIAEAILSSCNGTLIWSQGLYVPQVGVAVPSSRNHVLNADHLRGGIKFTTKRPKKDRANAVRGAFRDAASTFQRTDFSPVENSTYQTEDGEELFMDIDLPMTTNNTQAQRIAKQILEQSRQAIEVEFQGSLKCFPIAINDTVTLSIDPDGSGGNSAIFTNKKFRVITWKLNPDGGVDLGLQEYADAIYDWNYGEQTTVDLAPNTTLPDPTSVATISTPTTTVDSTLNSDGTFSPAVKVSWSAPSDTSFIGHYIIELQKRAASNAAWATAATQVIRAKIGGTNQVSHEFLSVVSGLRYRARVTAENSLGVQGTPSSYSAEVVAVDTTAPSAPTNVSATAGANQITVTWTNPTEADFDQVNLYRASTETGNYSFLGSTRGTSFVDAGISDTTQKWYKLKAVDFSGNVSAFSGSSGATTSAATARSAGFYRYEYSNTTSAVTGLSDSVINATNGPYHTASGFTSAVDKDWLIIANQSPAASSYIYNSSTSQWDEQSQFVDGDLLVTGTISGNKIEAGTIDADRLNVTGNLSAISADLGNVNVNEVLTLTGLPSGMVAGKTSLTAYNQEGFFVGRTLNPDSSSGFEFSHTNVNSSNQIEGVIHNDISGFQIFNPVFKTGGSASGGTTTYTTAQTINLGSGNTSITYSIIGGGGAGGYGLDDGTNNNVTGASGGNTVIKIRTGSSSGTVIHTATATGGTAGANAISARFEKTGLAGESSNGESGGSGGAMKSAGGNATSDHYGAGGGGGGGDYSNSGFNPDSGGAGGDGGNAGQLITATVDTSSYSGSTLYFEITSIGAGGAVNTGGDYNGGSGAQGVVTVSSLLSGMSSYSMTDILNSESYPTIIAYQYIAYSSTLSNLQAGDTIHYFGWLDNDENSGQVTFNWNNSVSPTQLTLRSSSYGNFYSTYNGNRGIVTVPSGVTSCTLSQDSDVNEFRVMVIGGR